MGNFIIGSAVKGCQEFKHSVFLALYLLLPEVQLQDKNTTIWRFGPMFFAARDAFWEFSNTVLNIYVI